MKITITLLGVLIQRFVVGIPARRSGCDVVRKNILQAALADLAKIYPDYKGQGYEIAGFLWWQGHKDQNPVHAARYEQNRARLIPTLRIDYDAPNAKFVLATGCGNPGRASFGLQIAEAQLAIADAKKHPEFAGNVQAVDSRRPGLEHLPSGPRWMSLRT